MAILCQAIRRIRYTCTGRSGAEIIIINDDSSSTAAFSSAAAGLLIILMRKLSIGILFQNPAPPNYTRYNSPSFDALFEKAITETNDSLQLQFIPPGRPGNDERCPVVPLWYDEVVHLVQPYVKNFKCTESSRTPQSENNSSLITSVLNRIFPYTFYL